MRARRLGRLGSNTLLVVVAAACASAAMAACSDDGSSSPSGSGASPSPTTTTSQDGGGTTPPPGNDASPPTDGGSDAESADACAGRRLCDSFESKNPGDAPGAPWKVETNGGGTVTVSDTRAFGGGKRSVKVTTASAQYQRAMFVASGAPLFGGTSTASTILYGRMMVWLEQPAADGVHWTMLSGEGPVTAKPGVRAFVRYGGQLKGKLMANYDTSGAKSDCWQHSATVMPIGKWVCFAWKLEGPKNDMTIAMDGANIADLHVGDKGQGCIAHDLGDVWYPPAFERAVLGWESYQTDVGHTMYVDDVILDDKPIGCPP